ncbi:MAG: hypothetical protein U0821_09155 [Chloroflexota bacterium]
MQKNLMLAVAAFTALLVIAALAIYTARDLMPRPATTGPATAAVQPEPKPAAPGQPKPTAAAPAAAKPAVPPKPQGKPAGASAAGDVDRERFAQATWAPGQLQSHFEKHGDEGPYPTVAAYDDAARATIRAGTHFTYVDRESDATRHGFYDRANNRFVGMTENGSRITTSFRPDRGEQYVRNLERSTYR